MSKRFEWHSYYKRMALDTKTNKIIKIIDTLNQQDQRIAELEEQLKNAIVPKFKARQEVFFKLWDGQEAIGDIIDVQYSTTSGVMYEIQYSDGCESDSDWFEEKDVWSKEEA